jgi:aromatic-L-amino-acid decarboxylase
MAKVYLPSVRHFKFLLLICKCFTYVSIVATIGTTSSGAIDNLYEIGQVRSYVHFHALATRYRKVKDYPEIWLHVDAAWAGMTLVCPEFRGVAKLDAINDFADSFCTNFHKVS